MTRKKIRKEHQDNSRAFKRVQAKTGNQKEYIRSIIENDVIFCTGPSGCGKSFVSTGIAAEHLHDRKIEQIIISRPLVCTGKDIGALPGDVGDKIHPYLMPMEENLKFFLGMKYFGEHKNNNTIRYIPIEIMRGSTFNNSYMLLDEAQNCTYEQIKMFITRMGEGSKVIINGDTKQTDLKSRSGLELVIDRIQNVPGVKVCRLTYQDIQRNGILGRILTALEEKE